MSSIKKVCYFKKPGKQNTGKVLKLVKEYISAENIRNIVVASTSGETGAKAATLLKGRNVVVVTHHYGFERSGESELTPEFAKKISANGAKMFTGSHVLSSAERAIRITHGTLEPLELIANTLRLMGQGTKVCVEIVLMAADAGLIPVDEDVVAVGGTDRGADTALRIKPANATRFFDLRIREIIAKPSGF